LLSSGIQGNSLENAAARENTFKDKPEVAAGEKKVSALTNFFDYSRNSLQPSSG
jgi:hypothetical protein